MKRSSIGKHISILLDRNVRIFLHSLTLNNAKFLDLLLHVGTGRQAFFLSLPFLLLGLVGNIRLAQGLSMPLLCTSRQCYYFSHSIPEVGETADGAIGREAEVSSP